LITLVPSGIAVDFLTIMERYWPSGVLTSISPLLWGREDYVRELFGHRVESLDMVRKRYVLNRFRAPVEFRDFFKANHPMAVALYRELADQPARLAALDRELLDVATRAWRHSSEGPDGYDTEFLVIVARKRG
jgi:hypothetical protein